MNSISYSYDMRGNVKMGRVLATSFAGLASFRTGNRERALFDSAGQTSSRSISRIDRLKQIHLLDGSTVTVLT
jgi:hypothetical protein